MDASSSWRIPFFWGNNVRRECGPDFVAVRAKRTPALSTIANRPASRAKGPVPTALAVSSVLSGQICAIVYFPNPMSQNVAVLSAELLTVGSVKLCVFTPVSMALLLPSKSSPEVHATALEVYS